MRFWLTSRLGEEDLTAQDSVDLILHQLFFGFFLFSPLFSTSTFSRTKFEIADCHEEKTITEFQPLMQRKAISGTIDERKPQSRFSGTILLVVTLHRPDGNINAKRLKHNEVNGEFASHGL